MIPTLPPILSRLRNALALLLILGGAAGIVAGTLSPLGDVSGVPQHRD